MIFLIQLQRITSAGSHTHGKRSRASAASLSSSEKHSAATSMTIRRKTYGCISPHIGQTGIAFNHCPARAVLLSNASATLPAIGVRVLDEYREVVSSRGLLERLLVNDGREHVLTVLHLVEVLQLDAVLESLNQFVVVGNGIVGSNDDLVVLILQQK